METLHADPWFVVVLDPAQKLVRVKRTSTPFGDPAEAEGSFTSLLRLIGQRDMRGYRVLVDARDAIGRNDPEFERTMARFRSKLFGSFERSAMLMRTVVGQMQAHRMQREQGGPPVEIYLDESEALRAFGLAPPPQ